MLRFTSLTGFLLCLLTLFGCESAASATFPVGVELEFSGSDFPLPPELREESASGPRIVELPCGPAGMCPSTDGVPILCEADLCNPAPQTIELPVGDVVDLDALAGDADRLFREIDTIEIISVEFLVQPNTLTVPTSEIELFWGPVGAVDIDESMGVTFMGTVPAIASGETGEGSVALDSAGLAAFTQHFETVAHRFRFFARTEVDLEPGGAFPDGNLGVAVRMSVRISGSLF